MSTHIHRGRENRGDWFISHDSVGDLIQYARDLPAGIELPSIRESELTNGDRVNFIYGNQRPEHLSRTYEEIYQQTIGKPWTQGIEAIRDLRKLIPDGELPKAVSVQRKGQWRTDDGEWDRDRMLSGRDDFWRGTTRVASQSFGDKIVTLAFDLATSAWVQADKIMWRGVVALVLADILEDAGYSVELRAVEYTQETSRSQNIGNVCVVKRSDQMLDISSLAATVSGWFFRTVMFRCKYVSTEPRAQYSGLGHPRNPPREMAQYIVGEGKAPEEMLLIKDVWDRNAAVSTLKQVLRKFSMEER